MKDQHVGWLSVREMVLQQSMRKSLRGAAASHLNSPQVLGGFCQVKTIFHKIEWASSVLCIC